MYKRLRQRRVRCTTSVHSRRHKRLPAPRPPASPPMSSAAEQLPQEELDEYKSAFAIFDRDGDGCITAENLGAVLRSLGQDPSDPELREMINEMDEDGNGSVDFAEFLSIVLRKRSDAEDEEDIRLAFRLCDRDGDGFICAAELQQMSRIMGQGELTDQEAEEMLHEASSASPAATSGGSCGQQRVQLSFEDFRRLVLE